MGLLLAFAPLVLVGTILYLLPPDERKRLAIATFERLKAEIREGRDAIDPLRETLRTRTRWPIVAPLLIVACVSVWAAGVFGSLPAPQWQIAWGASYTPRTTNGEWWRLVSYAFVHASLLHLFVTVAALLSLGVVLERMVGRLAFATVYIAAAVEAGAIGLWTTPATKPMLGASGAVFGLYGLLISALVYAYLRKPRLPWSSPIFKGLAVGAAPFVLYNLLTDPVGTPSELAGLATGLFAGLVLARRVVVGKPRVRRAVLVPATVAIVALVSAVPLRGTSDAHPAIAQIAAVESRTTVEYGKAVTEFAQGRKSAKALAKVIDKTILPALQADRGRIEALRGVPAEQRPLVEAARKYFKLREDSWRRRQAGLLAANDTILREANETERAALDAFGQVQDILGADEAAGPQPPVRPSLLLPGPSS
jgi:membrane associated rhomboid family serine protease